MEKKDKEKIRKNFKLLTEDLVVDESFLACLLQAECITQTQFEEQMDLSETKRRSLFLMLIQKRGPNAFRHFVDALMETGQQHLANKLDLELAKQWHTLQGGGNANVTMTAPQYPAALHSPMEESHKPASSEMLAKDQSSIDYGPPALAPAPAPASALAQPAVATSSQPFVFQPVGIESSISQDSQFINPSVQKLQCNDPAVVEKLHDKEVYQMCNKPRGRVVIVNNEAFQVTDKLGDREGSSIDTVNLSQLFEHMDFKVDTWKDYGAKELMEKVREESQHVFHETADAFLMFILSHGVRGYVYGVDGEKVLITDIVTQFDSKNCPSLRGKPKLFFIQACQGVDEIDDGGDKVDGNSTDAKIDDAIMEHLNELRFTDDEKQAPISLPEGPLEGSEMADIFIAYSTAPGHLSWRNTELGTWFVREFVLVCNENAHKEEIKELLRMVRKRVKQHLILKGHGQIPPSVDYLEKKFYFLPTH